MSEKERQEIFLSTGSLPKLLQQPGLGQGWEFHPGLPQGWQGRAHELGTGSEAEHLELKPVLR